MKKQIQGLLAGDAEQDKATSIAEIEAVKMAGTTDPVEAAYKALSDALIAADDAAKPAEPSPSKTPEPACP
jgi:hypothetical protein